MVSCKLATCVAGILTVLLSSSMAAIKCPESFSVVADPSNCLKYVQCFFGRPIKMPCAEGLGFSLEKKTCVYLKMSDCRKDKDNIIPTKKTTVKPSSLLTSLSTKATTEKPSRIPTTLTRTDTTTTTRESTIPTTISTKVTTQREIPVVLQRSIEAECERNPRARFPHPTKCAQYYDCSVIYKNIPKFYEQFLMECPYPQLYSDRSNRCRPFKNVKCGRREEPREPCDYIQNLCQTANCRPCNARFPSCVNRPNGINAWGEREWTPYFVQCDEGRLTDQGICEYNKGYPTLFSPESKTCVSIFTVPKKFGGYQYDCNRKRDGFYPDEKGDCRYYYECDDSEYSATFTCRSGRVFDPDTSLCKFPSEVKGRCRTYFD